jgi:Flp pilus assembly protein TadD
MIEQQLQRALSALQRGAWHEAAQAAQGVVGLMPRHPQAQALLGMALLQLDDCAGAIRALRVASKTDRGNAGVWGHLAEACARCGQFEDAHTAYRRAQRLAPAHWPYALGAAITLAQQGRAAEAEPLLRKLCALQPQQPLPHFNLGNVLLDLGRADEAESLLRRSLALAPDDAEILLSLGSALHRQSRFNEAIGCYRRCIAMHEAWPAPRLNLVSALIDDGRNGEAETASLELIGLVPQLAQAHRFLGAARGHQGNLLGAAAAYRQAASLPDAQPIDRRSLGGALAECGRLHEALRILATVPTQDAEDALSLLQLRSMIDLAHGRFADGWRAYRSRPAFRRLSEKWAADGIVQQLPDQLEGLHVLVRREQGLGDELFFLRQLPQLRARGARVTVRTSDKIADMIHRTGAADAVVADTTGATIHADVQIFCGDLPGALAPRAHSEITAMPGAPTRSMPDHPALIAAFDPAPAVSLAIPPLPEALLRMRQKLEALGPPPYLGLTWRAGTPAREQLGADWVLNKTITLPALGAALQPARGSLLALQRLPAPGEIETLSRAAGRPVADFTAVNDQLEDMLALLALLDDYIGVSNTNMHLRAAVGRSARVLVPNPAEWRWMQWGLHSPWFPDFRIYRQSLNGDWSGALAQLARDLAPA